MATEMLLHHMWEHRLWPYGALATVDGRKITVLDPGRRNTDAGPDFFNAKVTIGDQTWAGNVEIHVRASDWYRHNHHTDPAYDTVMLHVVGTDDCAVTRPDGAVIPQAVIPASDDYSRRYDAMVGSPARPACADHLLDIPSIYVTDWLQALGFERLNEKSDRVLAAVARLDGDWQAAAYVTLARALGFSTNSDAFERVAYATPLRCLLKHSSDPALIEAILMGQAGFLDAVTTDADSLKYLTHMREDYAFLAKKHGLQRPESPGWKMARMRPPSFPQRRMAALVRFICGGFPLGRAFNHITGIDDALGVLNIRLDGYWLNHFTFGPRSASAPAAFSLDSLNSLLINAVVPLLYAYGLYFGDNTRCDTAVDILHAVRAESNSLTRVFTDYGIPCDDAFTSQALIQLRRAYCEPRKCLYCRLGHRILAHPK